MKKMEKKEKMNKQSYKQSQPYKAFEVFYNSLQMNVKMYIYIAIAIFAIQTILVFIYLLAFKPKTLKLAFMVASQFYIRYLDDVIYLLVVDTIIPYLILSPIWLLFIPAIRYFANDARKMMADKHIRGSIISPEEEVARQIEQDITKQGQQLEKCYYIGQVPVPYWAENRHTLILGKPGTGKTTLINSILAKLRERNEIALIHDFKGDYIAKFYDPTTDLIFNPLDARSLHWCILDEVNIESDIDMIAHSLIPPTYTTTDRFWIDAARDVFAALVYYLVTNNAKTNQDVYRTTTLVEAEIIELIRNAVAQGIEGARRALGYMQGYEKGSKIASDTLATMKQYSNCFYYARHLGNQYSITNFVNTIDQRKEDQSCFVFVTNYSSLRDTLKPLVTAFIDITMKRILSLKDNIHRRVFFILDEFTMLQRMSSIIDLLTQGRSKGACAIIATQDITQLQKMYSPELASTITNCCNTIVSFAVQDASAEFMSRLFGEREIMETDENISMGVNEYKDGIGLIQKKKMEKTILPSEIASLKDFECFLKLLSYDLTQTQIKKFFLPDKNEPFILNDIFSLQRERNDA